MYPIKKDLLKINPYTRPGRKLRGVKGVVCHWTANENEGADDVAHRRYFGGNAISAHSYASAHYFVDQDSIIQIVPDDELAYHVGAMSYHTRALGSYPNEWTIGVETCVNVKGAGFKKALDQSAQLCAKLLKDHGLTVSSLYRHYDVTGKDCPRYFVNNTSAKAYGLGDSASKAWQDFKALVASYMEPKKEVKPVKKPAAKKQKFVEVIYKTPIAVRDKADFDAPTVETIKKGEVFTVAATVKSKQGQTMLKLKSGKYITAHDTYVRVFEK